MEKDCYQEIIAEVSKKLAEKFSSTEKNLAARATTIDSDILEIVKDIGLQTTKKVLENTRDEIVVKKKLIISDFGEVDYIAQYLFWTATGKTRNQLISL